MSSFDRTEVLEDLFRFDFIEKPRRRYDMSYVTPSMTGSMLSECDKIEKIPVFPSTGSTHLDYKHAKHCTVASKNYRKHGHWSSGSRADCS